MTLLWRLLRKLLRTILGRIYDLLPAPREEVVEAVNEVLDQIQERRENLREQAKEIQAEAKRLEAAEKALMELRGEEDEPEEAEEPEEEDEAEEEDEPEEGPRYRRRRPAEPSQGDQ